MWVERKFNIPLHICNPIERIVQELPYSVTLCVSISTTHPRTLVGSSDHHRPDFKPSNLRLDLSVKLNEGLVAQFLRVRENCHSFQTKESLYTRWKLTEASQSLPICRFTSTSFSLFAMSIASGFEQALHTSRFSHLEMHLLHLAASCLKVDWRIMVSLISFLETANHNCSMLIKILTWFYEALTWR
jgi:hypothetical protein